MALAVRTETPIFVAEAVLDQAAILSPQVSQMSESESESSTSTPEESSEVDESKLTPFKDFIESLDIDDLAGNQPKT